MQVEGFKQGRPLVSTGLIIALNIVGLAQASLVGMFKTSVLNEKIYLAHTNCNAALYQIVSSTNSRMDRGPGGRYGDERRGFFHLGQRESPISAARGTRTLLICFIDQGSDQLHSTDKNTDPQKS